MQPRPSEAPLFFSLQVFVELMQVKISPGKHANSKDSSLPTSSIQDGVTGVLAGFRQYLWKTSSDFVSLRLHG
ncbi:hypothetical protein RRG08_014979 [Elysia crispata]|uniref:Uncharacterized protein n=1 Tax=Elysia crispata TaxID=231223 RepID=A0AAE0ZWL0_9GAST|nr:hypothetical protein RRG08_014979 [Elysia crispata]